MCVMCTPVHARAHVYLRSLHSRVNAKNSRQPSKGIQHYQIVMTNFFEAQFANGVFDIFTCCFLMVLQVNALYSRVTFRRRALEKWPIYLCIVPPGA